MTEMGTYRAVIIDDEINGIEVMEQMLALFCPGIKVIGTALNIDHATQLINIQKPDLVFLDIEMPGGSGFELLDRLNHPDIEIIFVTAYQEYAIKAIKYSALEYLLKPVQAIELIESVKKLTKKRPGKITEQYRYLTEQLSGNESMARKIILPTLEEYSFVNISDIVYCESDNTYTLFYLTNGKRPVISKNLKEYEELLTPHNFFRIHRSYLINVSHIQKIDKRNGYSVLLSNGDSLPVAVRKRNTFLEYINTTLK